MSDASGTLANVADAVWNEALSGHVVVGSAGKALLDASGNLTDISNMVSGSVWDAQRANHIAAGSTGQTMQFSSSYIDDQITSRSTGSLKVYESESA